MAEDAWNTRDPARVALAYSVEQPLAQPRRVLPRTRRDRGVPHPQVEPRTRLSADQGVWAFHDNRIAVRFAYEWRDDSGSWFRAYGNENWEFDEDGLMRARHASINDLPIREQDRLYRWPLGRRPDDHPGLSALGL